MYETKHIIYKFNKKKNTCNSIPFKNAVADLNCFIVLRAENVKKQSVLGQYIQQ